MPILCCDIASYVIISLFVCLTSFADGDVTIKMLVAAAGGVIGDAVADVIGVDVECGDIFNFIKLFFNISSVALPPLE